MLTRSIRIDNYKIGNEYPCFVIAEGGVNHNGDLDLALRLVDMAKEVGADCIKFQTFKAESVVTSNAPKANYQLKVTSSEESQLEMLKKLELKPDDYKAIVRRCEKHQILFLSTPYNYDDAIFLNDLGVSAFKIASGQIVEHSFLLKVAALGKPLILSTGMATLSEVYDAIEALRSNGFVDIIVLQCTTNYPSLLEDSNIRSMNTMGAALNVLTGYSDHVPNNYACYAAVAKGACVIEKHFTLDKSLKGPDHSSSLDPKEFSELVTGIRGVEISLGSAVKRPTKAEIANTVGMRRSIVINDDIVSGTVLKESHIEFKRPATGIAPNEIANVIGCVSLVDIPKDTILQKSMISNTKVC